MKRSLLALLCAWLVGGCAVDRPNQASIDAAAQTERAVVRLSADVYVDEHAGEGVLIDVRTPEEVAAGHLQNARHINVLSTDFRERVEPLDRDAAYYLYCRSGNRSGQAAEIMKSMGFNTVYNIGGFAELKNAGAAVAP